MRSRSASPAKKRATSEGRAQDIKGSRALRATISDPVPARAPVFEAPARNSPESFVNPCKPRIVYPLSPGGTEIKPPPGGPPHSPIPDAQGQGTVLKQVPYPWPAPGGALWGSSPLTAPPGLSEEIRMGQECSGSAQPGPEYKSSGGDPLIQGLGSSGDVPANQGSRSGDQVSKGLEWFFDSMKKALTSYGDGEVRAEEVKTSLAELPKLVINEADKDLSPLLAGDWLTLSGPTMRDLSATSVQWWDQVLQAATDYYQAWLRATPVARLSMRPESPARFEGTKFARVEQRGLQLILRAVPNALKDELVSTQKMTCIDAVALVYCTYQPGGLKERSALLRFLTSPESASDVPNALKQIKRWSRWRRRAEQLEVSIPDPTLLLAGLDGLTAKALARHTEVVFRLSSFRYSLNIDAVPTLPKVCDLASMLQAELEALDSGAAKNPKAAKLDTPQDSQKGKGQTGKSKCKHWLSTGGCHYGRSCTFAHSVLGKGDKRCFNCSSTEHFREACPYPQQTADQGDANKSKGKTKKGAKKGDAGKPAASTTSAVETAAATQASDRAGSDISEEARQNMFKEVTAAIKQLTASAPAAAKALSLYPMLSGQACQKPVAGEQLGLLDSGASACVRPQESPDEVVGWRTVALAEGETTMGVNRWGTLLGASTSEPIVAMAKLVRMGFHIAWRNKTCTIVHPELGRVPVMIVEGCPRVNRHVALDLIRRIELWEERMGERSRRQDERVALVQQKMTGKSAHDVAEGLCRALWDGDAEVTTAWTEALMNAMFPETPDRIKKEVSTHIAHTPEALCWNRRKRRSIERSRGVLLHLCCGSCRGEFQATAARHGMYVLDVDCKENLNSPQTMSYLMKLAALGKFKGVLSGLPCRTRSMLRNRPPGPPVIRSRVGEGRWGLGTADSREQAKMFEDDCLLMRTLLLKVVASTGLRLRYQDSPPLFSLVENPSDPVSVLGPAASDLPSLWVTPEWQTVQEFLQVRLFHINQGPLGHCRIKPTTISAHGLYWPQWARDIRDMTCFPVYGGADDSSSWAAWAPGLKAAVREAIENVGDVWKRYQADPEALRALAPRKVRTSFADHVASGHVPFRADCRHCLEGRLRARPHRRQPAAESFVLSLDLMGPHRGGRDEVLDEVRYALVAVYTFPETLGVGGVAAPNDPDHGPPVDPEVQPWEEPEEPDPEEAAVAEAPVDLSDEAELPRVPMVELLWVEPLRRKTEAETLRATKRIKAAISLLGLPIVRIHTDAGKEFCNKSFRAWCSDNAFVKSCTGADDFRSNGRVENAIGVLKGRARTLLRAADSEWQDWPFALRHAAAQHRMFNFQRLGWKTEGLKPFNALVHVQERSWRIGEWGRRAVPARILAPAQEVERAYVVRTEDGNLRNVKVLFGGVREGPPVADDAPPDALDAVEAPMPPLIPRRVRGKSPGLGVVERPLGAVAKVGAAQNRLRLAHAEDEAASFLAAASQYQSQSASAVLLRSSLVAAATQGRTERSAAGRVIMFGAYSRGGIRGVSAATTQCPGLSALAVRIIKEAAPRAPFTSIALLMQTCALPHKDKYNLTQNNIIVPLELPSPGNGGGIWIEDSQGHDLREVRTGLWVRGRVVDLQKFQPFLLDPHKWHSAQPWTEGTRVLLVAFSVKGSLLLTSAERLQLQEAGFMLPDAPDAREGGGSPDGESGFSEFAEPHFSQNPKKPNITCAAPQKHVSFAEEPECVHVPWNAESEAGVVERSPAPAGVGAGDADEVGVGGWRGVDPAPAGEMKTCLVCSACCADPVGVCTLCERYVTQYEASGQDASCPGWGGGGPGELARTGTRAGSIGAGGCDARDAREEPGERSGENQAEDQLRACAEGNGPTDMGCCESLESVEGLTVFEAPECGFFVDATSCEEDSSIGCMWDGEGFEAFENRALNLKMMIDRECEFLKREAQTLEDCAVSEEFLVKAVRALGQAQDKAVEKAPEEVEFSLLPDCEILSSHTVPLQEVYKHFHLWRKAAEQELQSLIEEKGAFKRASLADLKRLEERGTKVVMVPGKAIFTRKSGGRFKCRVVICGNFVPQGSGNGDSQGDQASLYAAGCEVSHVRQIAARGARVGWAGFLLDIKTAFLNSLLLDPIKPRAAPPPTMTENPAEIIAVKPPKILIAHGLAKSDEYFLCLRAVYGLPQSPRDWGITRDVTIAGMEIVVPPTDVTPEEMPSLDHSTREALGKVMKLVPSASDSQVWALRVANADCDLQPGPALAWIAVYVDDILIMGPRAVALAVVNKIKAAWETGSMKKIPQLIEGTASFFGIEFAWRGNQLILGQQGYIQDLMKRYPHVKLQTTPLPPGNFEIPELAVEEKDPNALRACQTSLGEMLWIATRTRPDLMYGVSKLASEMSRNPVATLPYIEHLLGYLFNTVDVALVYGPKVPTLGESGSVATVSGANVLEVHTDAGFAPLAGRSQECAILFQEGAIVTWLSSKQPFTAQSTAESELLSTMTGFNVGRAHQLLASELCGGDVRLVVLNDNQACLQIIQVDNASWRTRHLRIRAAAAKFLNSL